MPSCSSAKCRTKRIASIVAVQLIALAGSAFGATAPPPSVDVLLPVAIVTGNGLPTTGVPDLTLPPLSAPITITRTQNPNGSVEISVGGGTVSVVHFGPGLAQMFVGDAATQGFARADVGSVRLSVSALADIAPTSYGPGTVGALGVNQFQTYAGILVTASFWDVVTPPVTAGKPVGSPTSLTLKPELACTATSDGGCRSCSPLTSSLGYSTSAALFQMDGTTDIGVVFTSSSEGGFFVPCPIFAQRTITGLTVGAPVLMKFEATLFVTAIAGNALNTGFPFTEAVPSTQNAVDALNTGFVTITDADGNPVVGQSGFTYDGEPVLDPITTTTTTTTTTTFVAPTTLPGCSPDAYCGDGVYQPECGEACDCPQPSAGQAATICGADTALPNLAPACALCAGCQVDESACATTTTSTPTTTLPAATTTTTTPTTTLRAATTTTPAPGTTSTTVGSTVATTTLPGPTVTSTTLPGSACAQRSGFDALQCVCTGGLATPECAQDRLPAAIGKLFAHGCSLVQHAQSSKNEKKIVRRADATFARDLGIVRTAESKKKHPLSHACGTALMGTVGEVRQLVDQLGHDL